MRVRQALFVAALLALFPREASAQSQTIVFDDGQTDLPANGYRIVREVAERVGEQPDSWTVTVRTGRDDLIANRPAEETDSQRRVQAVVLELAEQGVHLARVRVGRPNDEPARPIADDPEGRAQIVVSAEPVEAGPPGLWHGDRPVVYFDSGSAEVSPHGHYVLALAVAGPARIGVRAIVESYADTAGAQDANLRLANVRADNVARALVGLGVPWDRIERRAHGEALLHRPTPDGVVEPLNRVVTVRLIWPAAPAR